MKKEYYKDRDQLFVAVDDIIFGFDDGELCVLLVKRNFEPEVGKWSLIGGFVRVNESLDAAADRVLRSLTGLTDIQTKQIYAFGDVYRDTADRTISVVYYSLVKLKEIDKIHIEENAASWHSITSLPELIFDHQQMINMALRDLQVQCRMSPVGIDLLPDRFTLPELQKLYEAIYQKNIDKRNFRKRILATGLFVRLEEKDKESSKRGAFYYQFDWESYYKDAANKYLLGSI
ncbi:MAG: NUDIX hydrolase [Bacteroidota bacterium]